MSAALRFAWFVTLAAALPAAEPAFQIVSPEKTLTFTAGEFAALPHVALTAADPHSKAERHFTGVAMRELLARVGAPLGEKFHGPASQLAVLARAQDGYAVVFALAEFDDAFSSRTVLLADAEDGKPLADKAGPLELIAPGDKKAARWARMITSLEIVTVGAVAPRQPVAPKPPGN